MAVSDLHIIFQLIKLLITNIKKFTELFFLLTFKSFPASAKIYS